MAGSMNTPLKDVVIPRREFFYKNAAALAFAGVAPFGFFTHSAKAADPAGPTRKIRKGIMWGTMGVSGSVLEKMKAVKEAGFEGVEMNSHMDQEEVLRARDETGLVIPSVCGALQQAAHRLRPEYSCRGAGGAPTNPARCRALRCILGSSGARDRHEAGQLR